MSRTKSMSLVSGLHSRLVLSRRSKVLAAQISTLMPATGSILDVGCGNGVISQLIMGIRPALSIEGIDVLKRPRCAISMEIYDGRHFPRGDKSVDVVLFVDVLHHTDDPLGLLREAARVARHAIIVKDHFCDSPKAERILAFMDWIGNRAHGVALPYNYRSSAQWEQAWRELGYTPNAVITQLGLYPWFARPVFEQGLHFIAHVPLNSHTA